MLRKLSISNYVIIDQLDLIFSDSLTVITGETGAGKSIAMEALSLALGERADVSVVHKDRNKCIVEATFVNIPTDLQTFFELHDLDFDDPLMLRREISAAGKSRAFINDTPVNLSVLKALGDQLVDMHNQHESMELSSSPFQLAVLDSMARHEDAVRNYRARFITFQNDLKQRDDLHHKYLREVQELDYLQFQFNELSDASLKADEQASLEQDASQLENAEEIRKNLEEAHYLISDSEYAVQQQLKQITSTLNTVRKFYPPSGTLADRVNSVRIELEDIANDIERQSQSMVVDRGKLEEITQRLDLIYRLQKKHRVSSNAELIKIAEELDNRIHSISIQTESLETLDKSISVQRRELISDAKKISSERQKQIPVIEEAVNRMLTGVGMPHASIRIDHQLLPENELRVSGIDHYTFLFSSNRGGEFQEIRKVASGGELSRLMLCFKSLIAASTALPTLVFDEIDSGISGETSIKVSNILTQLSAQHQVICITHLPQIAAKGDSHYFVYKEVINGNTYTRIKKLTQQEKVNEIAKMISGEKVTDASLASARELLN